MIKNMSESDHSNEGQAEIGGGRASVESLGEFLKDFKSSRMSFEPLDTWLFLKAVDEKADDSSNDIKSVEYISDCNDACASSESDSSAVYHFDSDDLNSSNDDDDCDDIHHTASDALSVYAVTECDKGKTFTVKKLADSPGRSGSGVKVFSEEEQSDVLEEVDSLSDASSSFSDSLISRVDSVQKCFVDSCQPASNSVSTDPKRGVLNCGIGCVPETTCHQYITYRVKKCHADNDNDCGVVVDNFESPSKKLREFATDFASSGRHRHAIQNPSIAGTEYDDSIAEHENFDADKADVNDTLKRVNKRQRIAQELMDTEATYQRHLELIVEV